MSDKKPKPSGEKGRKPKPRHHSTWTPDEFLKDLEEDQEERRESEY